MSRSGSDVHRIALGKFSRQFDCSSQQSQVMVSGDFDTAELLEMRGKPLRVQQGEFAGPQMLYERHERNLRGI